MGYVVARGRLLVLLASAAVKLVVATQSNDVLLFAVLFAFDQILLSVMFYVLYRRRFGQVQWRQASPAYGLKLLRQSSWLVMSALAATLNLKVGQLMLGELVSRQATGIYAVASRLSEVWYFLPDALMAAFFPRMLDLRKSSATDYQVLMQRLCDALFVGSTLLAGVVTVFAAPVIKLLYGAAYAESAAVLSIHVWAGVFVFMRALFSRWLIAEGLLKYSLMSHGAGALVNVALNFLLIPAHGPIGAAISALLAYLVSSYLCLMLFSRTRPMAGMMTRSLLLLPTAGYRYWR
jgi:PST family polysaccharide transporter